MAHNICEVWVPCHHHNFLGIHTLSSIQKGPDCVKAVKDNPRPETLKQLQQFLGYSTIARPLH